MPTRDPFAIKRGRTAKRSTRHDDSQDDCQECRICTYLLTLLIGLFLGFILFGRRSFSSNLSDIKLRKDTSGSYVNPRDSNDIWTGKPDKVAITCGHKTDCSCEDKYPQTLTNMMEPDQKELLAKYIKGKNSYFEWGSGGSTDYFPRLLNEG